MNLQQRPVCHVKGLRGLYRAHSMNKDGSLTLYGPYKREKLPKGAGSTLIRQNTAKFRCAAPDRVCWESDPAEMVAVSP